MKKISRSAIVEHSAAQIYALVEDIEAYPKFLPWCREARVHERAAAETRATLTIGVGGLRQSVTTRNENRPGEAIDMRLVESPFREFTATWRFSPLSAGALPVQFSLPDEFSSRNPGPPPRPAFHTPPGTPGATVA